jgi:CubicO group peptidase (beta-lactamase class C family)
VAIDGSLAPRQHHTMRHFILALPLLLTVPGSAQSPTPLAEPTPQLRSLAAGYVALTTCSAFFTARRMGGERTIESIRANELRGVYPEINAIVQETQALEQGSAFGVRWSQTMRMRHAGFDTRTGGCTLSPVGRGERPNRDYVHNPAYYSTVSFNVTRLRGRWPMGDARALARPQRDAPAFAAVTARALGQSYGAGSNTTALVIVQNGQIVGENYAAGFSMLTPQRTWSVAKSLATTIIGAAVQRGEVDVNAEATVPEWQRDNGDPRGVITLDNLLRMSSGLTSDTAGNRTDAIYFGGTAVDEQAPGWPLIAEPGSTFRYANNDTLLATLAIAPTFRRHPPRDFFASVDMHATVAETDWRGNYVLSSQVWSTARDLARFGMLYLNDGEWNGRRILPENWRTYVTTPSGPQPTGDFGYGAGFWLMNRSEGVPPDTFAAVGNRGQYVVIVPSRNIVIVRRGEDPSGTRFDIAAFTRDVLAALR